MEREARALIAEGRDSQENLVKAGHLVITDEVCLKSATVSNAESFRALAQPEGIATFRARSIFKL